MDELEFELMSQGGYRYLRFGHGHHGHSEKIWISKTVEKTLKTNSFNDKIYAQFPIEGAQIYTNDKNIVIIKPGTSTLVVYTTCCGYRGDASIERWIKEPQKYITVNDFASQRGALGRDEKYIIEIGADEEFCEFVEHRTGRRIGENYVQIRLYKDNKIQKMLSPDIDPKDLE